MSEKIQAWYDQNLTSQSGKTIIITGANSGIGYEAAKTLAKAGAEIIMACRNVEKAETAVDEMLSEVPQAKLQISELNLASLKSVKKFVKDFKAKYKKLDVLINNAGVMAIPRTETEDGFEMQLGVNHLGHFALTGQLIDLILKTKDSRIVNVASIAHKSGKFDWSDLMSEKKYGRFSTYARSKLANLLFTIKLQQKLNQVKENVKAIAVHPGYSATNLQFQMVDFAESGFVKGIMSGFSGFMNSLIAQSAEMGSLPAVYAAVSDQVKGGSYYGPVGFNEMRGFPEENKYNPDIVKQEDANKLWVESEKLTGVKFGV